MITIARLSGDVIHDPALQISFAIAAALILAVAIVLILRSRRKRRERERQGQHPTGPWWRGPNAPTENDPVFPRHGDQSGAGGI